MASAAWRDLFPLANVFVDMVICSDHAPLLLCLTEGHEVRRVHSRFRYEAKWWLDGGYKEVLREAWLQPLNEGNSWVNIKAKMGSCQHDFLRWQKD